MVQSYKKIQSYKKLTETSENNTKNKDWPLSRKEVDQERYARRL